MWMKKNLFIILFINVLLIIVSCSQEGDTGPTGPAGEDVAVLEFQQGNYPSDAYTGVTDAYLEAGSYSDTNYGNATSLFIGRYVFLTHDGAERFVLKFNLNDLQSQHIKVKKAQIILYCSSLFPISTTMTVTPYEVTESWFEGDVTWNSRTNTAPWSVTGGAHVLTSAGNSVYIDGNYGYKIFNINASVVQKWIDNPGSNYGLIFISDTENIPGNRYAGFYSKDYATINYRPKLVIYYTLN
jgi:hypothetical protein